MDVIVSKINTRGRIDYEQMGHTYGNIIGLQIDKPVRFDILKDGRLQGLERRCEKFNPGNNYRMIKGKPLSTKRNYNTNH